MTDSGGRICGTCWSWQPWTEFAASRRYSTGREPNCRTCSYWRNVRNRYGLTPEEYQWLLERQNGVCALCQHDPAGDRRLSVDHDHSCCGSNRACKLCIRGLLCLHCNRILGLAEKRPGLTYLFAEYRAGRPLLKR